MRRIQLFRAMPLLALLTPAGERSAVAQSADDLLPDLVVDRAALTKTRIDKNTLPGRRLLRLSTSTPNVGAGALEIRGSTVTAPDQQQVLQRIYRSDGSSWDRLAGAFTYHPTHMHTHFDGWAVYRLRSVLADGSPGPVVSAGEKTSFCLLDVVPYDAGDQAPTVAAPAYTTCGYRVQGISPGWADVYDLELDGQWVDVTDLPDQPYWLEAEVDPEQRIVEMPGGEDNNIARIRVLLGPQGATPDEGPDPFTPDPPQPIGAAAPHVEFVAPAAAVTWVEHSYAGLPVSWTASDPDGDAVSVTLYVDRDQIRDADTLPLGGYANLRGSAGQAVINTAALDLGTWYLFAEVSDGSHRSGSWAPGSIIVYAKGDLDFDGHVDREDWVALVQRRRERAGQPWSSALSGWEPLLDQDRDADLDDEDIALFRSAALRYATEPGH